MRKRCNRRRLPVAIPTTGLVDEFGIVLHSALMAADMGKFGYKNYDALAQAVSVVHRALCRKPLKDESHKRVLDGTMRALADCKKRDYQPNKLEIESMRAGVAAIEAALPKMSVTDLYIAMQELKMYQVKKMGK